MKQAMTTVILLIILAGISVWKFSTNKHRQEALMDSFQLVQQELSKENRSYDYTKDWVDLVFSVTEKHLSDIEPSWVKAEGVLNGQRVGFIAEINDKTSKFLLDKDNKLNPQSPPVPQGIVLKTAGQLSSNLASEYYLLFENSKMSKDMVDSISFTSLALRGEGSQIATQPVKYKLFFDKKFEDPNSIESKKFYEEDYFEFYINFDLPNNLVYLMEKDTSYRKYFLKAFLK